jgi:MBOAT, membrane-bound O-acyltransferase family
VHPTECSWSNAAGVTGSASMLPPDYILTYLGPFHLALGRALTGGAPPTFWARCILVVSLAAQLAAVAVLTCHVLARLRSRVEQFGPRDPWVRAARVATALLGFSVLNWVLHHPSDSVLNAVARWDHWFLCALAGHLLDFATHRTRKWAIVGMSIVFLGHYLGNAGLAIVASGALVGWAAVRRNPSRPAGHEAALQAAVIIAVLGYLIALLPYTPLVAMQGWGLACWVLMRHVSFVVEARRGASTALVDYLTYQTFLPTCIGAMEVYDEFAERNLRQPGRRGLRAAAIGSVRAQCLMSLAVLLPVSQSSWLDATTFAEVWSGAVLWFLRGALFLTGSWYILESEASLLGFQLRPNFRGIVTAENPAQFWRAWRGTMTHWLVRYVYVPLGGNRHHQTRNTLAAFVVSTLWHLGGLPFLHPKDLPLAALVPTTTWGAANFAGVALHGWWRRRWPPGTWVDPANVASRALKIFLTACFGSLTVTVLGFPFERTAVFGRYVLLLLGFGP